MRDSSADLNSGIAVKVEELDVSSAVEDLCLGIRERP